MDCIVPHLWLGNMYAARDIDFIKSNQIKCIINVTRNIPNFFEEDIGIQYLRIPVENRRKYICLFKSFLEIFYHLIDEFIRKREGVLVHCKRGHRRSIMVITYYLMKKYNLSYEEVRDYVTNIRPLTYKCPMHLKHAFI